MAQKIATVFGGTGFVGRQVVRALAQAGYVIKIATRVSERAYFLKPCGVVGQVVPFACNYQDEKSIVKAVQDADIVVNCTGILFEKRRGDFARIHSDLPKTIAKACKKAQVKRFIHISALDADTGTSKYAKTKLAGEKAAFKAFPDVTILRPSVIFGDDDNFFNMFARLSTLLPVLPLIGGGKTKFQPVFVGDVAGAVMRVITEMASKGQIYELGGPEVLSFKEIYQLLFRYTCRKRMMVPLPFWFAKIEAFFLALFPAPLLTPDQVESLKTDNIVGDGSLSLIDLGINPTCMDLILPAYLERYRPGGRFGDERFA